MPPSSRKRSSNSDMKLRATVLHAAVSGGELGAGAGGSYECGRLLGFHP